MQLHDLFEGNEQAYNWHSEPEQRSMDATRQARLNREREPEGSEAIDARIRARYDQLDQYNQSGKFWLKQKDTQEHISDAMIGKAAANAAAVELLKQRPELRGNLVITAYGPGESQGVAEAPGAETLSHNQSTVSSNLNSLDLGEGDISQLEKDIAAAPVAPIANMEADEKIGGRHDPDDFDAMVGRLKKLAGAGPMKTVYDPNKRVYRNVPTAVQPAQQPKK